MKSFLDEVGKINSKYEALSSKKTPNVFSIITNHEKEKFHSDIIAALLNIKELSNNETRIFDDIPLKSFLKIAELDLFEVNEDCCVKREYKNIDILITNRRQAIIIENKVWAKDQDNQLARYYKIIEDEGYTDIFICYLTPFGWEPSEQSVKDLDKEKVSITLLSYKIQIQDWIDKCLELAHSVPIAVNILKQYQDMLKLLIGDSLVEKEKNEIIELLSCNDNMIKAAKIADNWIDIKWNTEFLFWKALEEKLKSNEYNILEINKYSEDCLNSVYCDSRNRNPWYGIICHIANIDNIKLCLFIERSFENIYYGLILVKNGKIIENIKKFSELAKKLKPACEWPRENQWLGGNFFKKVQINFETFSEKDTLLLLNSDSRKNIINKCINEINDFVEECKKCEISNIEYLQ